MEKKWLVSRRLVTEKLNTIDQEIVYAEEKKKNRMLGANEIIKMFFGKLKWLKDKEMPVNADDLFFSDMIPCIPKLVVEMQKKVGDKLINETIHIGGSQILEHFDSRSIVNVLHLLDSQMDFAKKSLWDSAIFSKKQTEKTKANWDEVG